MLKRKLYKINQLLILLLLSGSLYAQRGLYVNEASNGTTGSQEFMEFITVGDPGESCATIDIRGWIFDDNNGDFACGPRTGVGIAQGHAKFDSSANWSAIPLGSIIVVYNDGDPNPLVPGNDPYDANGDSVYIIPISNPNILKSGTRPIASGSSCPGAGSSAYFPATYAASTWSVISMANGDDVSQVRRPDGSYFHGISYGTPDITGGPDNLLVHASSGSGDVFYFTDTDPRDVANWSQGTAGTNPPETPGLANNALNEAFIRQFRCPPGPLSVNFKAPFEAHLMGDRVLLQWTTSIESNLQSFEVLRSRRPGDEPALVATISAKGSGTAYGTYDESPLNGESWYALRSIDLDGQSSVSDWVRIENLASSLPDLRVYPNPAGEHLTISATVSGGMQLRLIDLNGRVLLQRNLQGEGFTEISLSTADLAPGIYLYEVSSGGHTARGKWVRK